MKKCISVRVRNLKYRDESFITFDIDSSLDRNKMFSILRQIGEFCVIYDKSIITQDSALFHLSLSFEEYKFL